MAIKDEEDDPRFKGIHKYFNSYTTRGRSNWGKLCLGFYLFCFITYKAIRSATKPAADASQATTQPRKTGSSGGNQPSAGGHQTPGGPWLPGGHGPPPSSPWTLPIQEYDEPCERGGQHRGVPPQAPHQIYPYPPPPPGCYPYFPGQGAPPLPEGGGDRGVQIPPPYPYCYPPPMYYPPGAFPPPPAGTAPAQGPRPGGQDSYSTYASPETSSDEQASSKCEEK